jgi:hypothetical protein
VCPINLHFGKKEKKNIDVVTEQKQVTAMLFKLHIFTNVNYAMKGVNCFRKYSGNFPNIQIFCPQDPDSSPDVQTFFFFSFC